MNTVWLMLIAPWVIIILQWLLLFMILIGWKRTIEQYGRLINKIKTWGNTTSENESVSTKAEEANSTAQDNVAL